MQSLKDCYIQYGIGGKIQALNGQKYTIVSFTEDVSGVKVDLEHESGKKLKNVTDDGGWSGVAAPASKPFKASKIVENLK